jgi:hypothetical protein
VRGSFGYCACASRRRRILLSRDHRNRILSLVFLVALALLSCQGRAQSIPSSWKTAGDCEQYRAQITAAVKLKLPRLISEDGETAKYARNWFVEQVTATQTPSASFMDVYADVVNNALENLVDPKLNGGKPVSLRVRLNAAIVNAAIAQHTSNARQATATNTFLHDPSEAVVLWGIKAAKFELPTQLAQLAVMRKPDLVAGIIDAVRAHPDSGAIADEAFIALSLDVTDRDLRNTYAVVFLTRTKVWDLETADQQQKVMELLYSYLEASTKLLLNPASTNHDELLNLIRQVGRAFEAIADVKADPALKKAAELTVAIGPETKSDDIDTRLSTLKAAIH